MDEKLGNLAARGYDVDNDPRERARQSRRRRLLQALGAVVVLGLVLGGLAVLDEVDRRRAEAVLPDLARELATRVDEAQARDVDMPVAEAADDFRDDPSLELPGVGTYLLASNGRKLAACVDLDPWLGGQRYSCVPLADPDAEPTSFEGGATFYVLAPE
ncbi:MAG: hypothetical protein ABF306_02555 [Nocardioides marinisabuli]|uniref:hypothetical protein n=1 Tax=Nocardioides marinisabuli TaxID=419476 RepID=UPI00321AFC68